MKLLNWCVCLVKGHVFVGPDECHTLEDVPFSRWYCSRCLLMFASAIPSASLPRRGGFFTAAKSALFEIRILPGRVRHAVARARRS